MLTAMKRARERVQALRMALEGPSADEIGAALPGLEEARSCLEAVERELETGCCAGFDVRRELQMLKNDLRTTTRLVEHGVAFCHGWARLLGAGPCYTQTGQPAPGPSEGTLSLQG